VGYLRSSRPGGPIPDEASEPISSYVAANALSLRCVYRDDQRPGDRRGRRTAFAAALADVREGRADGVLVPDLAHLSTHPDIRDSLAFLITEAGGRLFIADDRPQPT
jgi:DNA invertase Pin-like site-specific DNA recombinase